MATKLSSRRVVKNNESFEMDTNSTKVIVRKFDIPLPSRNVVQPTILRSQLSFCTPKEKWKYQHDVPDGKIVTKRVYTEPNSANSSCVKSESSCITNSHGSKLFINAPQCETVKQLPAANKSILVVSANEQTSKVLAPVNKTVNSEKITVNNLPENVIPNSIKVVDTKIVDGKKVYYLKAFKEVGKVVRKNLINGCPEATVLHNNKDQNKGNNLVVKSVSESETVKSPLVDPKSNESKTVLTAAASSSNNLDHKILDLFACKSTTVNDSESRTMLTVAKPSSNNGELGKIISTLGKPVTLVRSIPQLNVVSGDGKTVPTAVSLPCDVGEKRKESQMNSVTSGVNKFTKCYSRSSVHSQINSDPKKSDTPVVRPYTIVSSGKSIPTNVLKEVVTNSGKEITLQLGNGISKLHGTIINSDISKLITENKSVIPHESINRISEDIVLPVKHVLHVDELTGKDDQLKLVPADSTTPFISTSVGSTILVDSLEKNAVPLEAEIVIHREGRRNSMEGMIDTAMPHDNISGETLLTMNNKHNRVGEKVFILNQSQNNCLDSNTVKIPKQISKYDDIMRRRKIALQYQRDVHKDRDMPRREKIVEFPARKVKLVDTSTQTTLFSMLEPGRMVEMLVTEDSDGKSILKLTKNQNEYKSILKKNQNHRESDSISSRVSDDSLKLSANKGFTKEIMDAPFCKRMRLDLSNSATEQTLNITTSNTLNEISDVSFNMDTSDLEQMQFQSLEKENFIEMNNMPTKSLKSNESEIRDVNYLSPLSCVRSVMNRNYENSALNCIINQLVNKTKIDKKMMLTLYKDYRGSLVPDGDGNLPIHNAVMDKDLKQVQRQCIVLTGQKKSVDVRNRMEETPLHLAVLCHNLPVVNLLLKYNAKTDVPDSEGNTALHMALKWTDDKNILDTLLKFTEDNSPALDVPNDEGYSLLHVCALLNKGYEALMLIKKKADINIRDRKSGRTPLFHSVESGHKEMARMLVKSGASTTITNFSGQSPLNASEVTLVLDQLSENTYVCTNEVIAPCPCRTDEQPMSNDKTCVDVQRASMEELDVSEESDLLNCNFAQAFHDR